jgi:hypothetical protein
LCFSYAMRRGVLICLGALLAVALLRCASFGEDGRRSAADSGVDVLASDTGGEDADVRARIKRLYVVGGVNPSGEIVPVVRSVQVGGDGSFVGEWRDEAPLPGGLFSHSVVTFGRTIVAIGGQSPAGMQGTVLVSRADENGVLDRWRNVGVVPVGIERAAATDGKFIHLLGGQSGADVATSLDLVAAVSGTDEPESFKQTTMLPVARHRFAAVRARDALIAFGGLGDPDAGADAAAPSVDMGRVNGDGTVQGWTKGPQLLPGLFGNAAVAIGDDVYVIGGFTVMVLDRVYRTRLGDGGLEGWVPDVAMPAPRTEHCAVTLGRAIYVVGGVQNSSTGAPVDRVDSNATKDDGALREWKAGPPYPVGIRLHACGML